MAKWRKKWRIAFWWYFIEIYANLVPLYLVTVTISEAENFSIGPVSYGLQSVIVKIDKFSYQDPSVFQRVSRKP